jgi:hypothetical protein
MQMKPAYSGEMEAQRWIATISAVVALLSAVVAWSAVRVTQRSKAADFLFTLHQRFFEEEIYSEFRDLLDDREAHSHVEAAVAAESNPLIAFLNFFEFAAYLVKRKVLEKSDVLALFGYYLQLIKRTPAITKYTAKKDKSFSHLNTMLDWTELSEEG